MTVVLISGVVGVGLGAISGYFAGLVDFVIQKFVEVIWAFPPLLLAIAIMAFFGQGLGNLILALVMQRWISYCRVARGQALSMRSREFVEGGARVGRKRCTDRRPARRANLFPVGRVIGTFAMASAIISRSSAELSGTWRRGSMLADGRTYISTSWWLAPFPGLCIFFTVLGINLLGDGLRDLLDPRLKRSGSGIG